MPEYDERAMLLAALRTIADELMCDEDNDNPCGTRDGDDGQLCNPCRMRWEALEAIAAATHDESDERLIRYRAMSEEE